MEVDESSQSLGMNGVQELERKGILIVGEDKLEGESRVGLFEGTEEEQGGMTWEVGLMLPRRKWIGCFF